MLRRPPAGPWDFPARLTWWLGIAALLPPLAPLAASLAAVCGLIGHLLCSRRPERYTGKKWIWAGLGLCIVAMVLFFAEAGLFLEWKRRQAASEREAVSRLRLQRVAEALERYREEKGRYPDITGIHRLKDLLEPAYAADLPVTDGFEASLSVWSRPEGFRVETSPLPLPGGGTAPPLFAEGHFQPSPSPPPRTAEGSALEEAPPVPAWERPPTPAPPSPGPPPEGRPEGTRSSTAPMSRPSPESVGESGVAEAATAPGDAHGDQKEDQDEHPQKGRGGEDHHPLPPPG